MDSTSTGPFDEIERSVLAEDIVNELLELIRKKRLTPGDKLPSERRLASIMKVSRPSLREALRALSLMNVIEIRPGSGAYVTNLQPQLLVEHLDFVFSLDDSTFLQLLEARKILEVGTAGLAATRVTDMELKEMLHHAKKAEASVDDPAAFVEADINLHEAIARAAGNPILERFTISISRLGRASRARTVSIKEVRQQTVDDHQSILDALQARDRGKTMEMMLRHLLNVEEHLRVESKNRDDGPAAK